MLVNAGRLGAYFITLVLWLTFLIVFCHGRGVRQSFSIRVVGRCKFLKVLLGQTLTGKFIIL